MKFGNSERIYENARIKEDGRGGEWSNKQNGERKKKKEEKGRIKKKGGGEEEDGKTDQKEKKTGKGKRTNLSCFQLAPPIVAQGIRMSKCCLVIHKTQFLELLLFLHMAMPIHTVLTDSVSILGSTSIRSDSIVLSLCSSEEERTSHYLGSGFFGGCKFLQLIGWRGIGCNTGELDDLFDVDSGAGFDPSRTVVLLVIFLDVDVDVEDGIGVVISVIWS